LYLGFIGLGSLFAISALFGLVQGGILPRFAIVIAKTRRHVRPAAVRRGEHGERRSPTARCGTCSTPVLFWPC
jgi:hypothetical protein